MNSNADRGGLSNKEEKVQRIKIQGHRGKWSGRGSRIRQKSESTCKEGSKHDIHIMWEERGLKNKMTSFQSAEIQGISKGEPQVV